MNKLFICKSNCLSPLAAVLVLFTVIIVIPNIYDAYRYSTILSSCYVSILMFFIWIISGKEFKIKITIIDILVCIAFVMYTFRLPNPNLGSLSLFGLYPVYIVFRFGKINYSILYQSVLIAAFILSTTGYLQWAGIIELVDEKYPVTGFYYNSAIYGGILCFLLSILFPVWLSCNKKNVPGYIKYLSVFVVLYSLSPLIISNSRSSWLALCAAIAFILYQRYRNAIIRLTFGKKNLLILFIFVMMSFSGYFLYQLKSDSANGRILIWKVTIEMIKDKPLLGYGESGFYTNYMHYQAKYLKEKGSENEKYLAGNNHLVFNEPLRIVVEYGITGILFYLGFVYLIFFRNKRTDIVSLTGKSFIITYLVWGLFSYPNSIFPALLYVTITTAIISNREQNVGFTIRFRSCLFKNIKIVHLIAFVVFLFYLVSQHHAYYRFRATVQNEENTNKEGLLRQLSSLEPDLSNETGYVVSYTLLLFEEKQDSMFIQQLMRWEKLHPVNELYILKGDYFKRCGNYPLAEENYWLAHYMAPSRQRARTKLAFLYYEMGNEELTKQIANEVLTEKVKVYGFETYRLHEQLNKLLNGLILSTP